MLPQAAIGKTLVLAYSKNSIVFQPWAYERFKDLFKRGDIQADFTSSHDHASSIHRFVSDQECRAIIVSTELTLAILDRVGYVRHRQ